MNSNMLANVVKFLLIFSVIPFVTIAIINLIYTTQIEYNLRNWAVTVGLMIAQAVLKQYFSSKN